MTIPDKMNACVLTGHGDMDKAKYSSRCMPAVSTTPT